MLQASSPGLQALQTSGLTLYAAHDVATPTTPSRAPQRSPSQRMPLRSVSTYCGGMRASAASSSNEKRGHAAENAQQAPHDRQTASDWLEPVATTSSASLML